MRWPTGVELTIFGMALLAASLVQRHVPSLHSDLMIGVLSWAGSILVVVGVGKILFLE